MKFLLTCFHIIFSSVWVAEWQTSGIWLLTRLTIYSLCILTICKFSYFSFGFLGLIASVPGRCILFTLIFLIWR